MKTDLKEKYRSQVSSWLQIFAIWGVILTHTLTDSVIGLSVSTKIDWWLSVITDSLFRWSVPMFIMLSGYWVLSKKFTYKRFYRVGLPLLFWSAIYFFWLGFIGDPVSIKDHIIKTLVFGQPYYHLYFLYIILGLYGVTPIIKNWLEKASKKNVASLLLVIFLIASFSNLLKMWYQGQWFFDGLLSMTLFLPYLGYYVAGNFLSKIKVNSKISNLLIFIFLASVAFTTLGTSLLINLFGNTSRGLILQNYLSPNIITMSLSLFVLAFNIPLKDTINTNHLRGVSKLVFGVYLIHPIILRLTLDCLNSSSVNIYGLGIAVSVITLFLSGMMVLILSGIPFLKILIGE